MPRVKAPTENNVRSLPMTNKENDFQKIPLLSLLNLYVT